MQYAGSTRLLLGLLCIGLGTSAAENPSDDQAYLDALQGSWTVRGTVGKQSVTYSGLGTRVLHGGFLELHLLDTGQPPQYEADVFIGYDSKAHDYIVHWLDQFGAAGARVIASGHRDGDRLVVTFPYAEGDFRDTFTRDAVNGTWTLLMESKEKSGAWSTFASFTLQRAAAAKASQPVLGIGGLFFRGKNPKELATWYETHLGVTRTPTEYGKPGWQQAAGPTVFQPFPLNSSYFGDEQRQWMVNFRVQSLDALVGELRASGIEVKVDPMVYPNGRFARLHDPDGNPVELWEPKGRFIAA